MELTGNSVGEHRGMAGMQVHSIPYVTKKVQL